MKIVNLKQEAPEMEVRPSDYPWGLCLHLGSEELEKLGITTLPAIGQSVQIAGAAVVVALRQDGECRSMHELVPEDSGDGLTGDEFVAPGSEDVGPDDGSALVGDELGGTQGIAVQVVPLASPLEGEDFPKGKEGHLLSWWSCVPRLSGPSEKPSRIRRLPHSQS